MSHPDKTEHVDLSGTSLPEGHSIPSRQRPDPQLPDELQALEEMFEEATAKKRPIFKELGIDESGEFFNLLEPIRFFYSIVPLDELAGRRVEYQEEDTLFESHPHLKRKAILLAARELLVFYRDVASWKVFEKTYGNLVLSVEINRAMARTAMRLLLEWDRLNFEEVAA